MLIDWFTVGAQALNFIVLVWLMKRFLYQPILGAIDAREKKIADELARANKISEEANQEKAEFKKKNTEFDQQRDQLLEDASTAADAERQRLQEEARGTAEQLATKQQQTLQNNMQTLLESVRSSAQKELFAMAKNALRDLGSVEIEAQMIKVFLERLRQIEPAQKTMLEASLKAKQVVVLSSGELQAEQKTAIEKGLAELFDQPVTLEFEQSTDLIGGIELNANGFKLGWSVAEYLHALDATLSAEITQNSGTNNGTEDNTERQSA